MELPETIATLTINDLLVTSKHSHHLRTTYHSIQMREYLEDSNKWTGNTIETIWWKIHGSSIESNKQGKTTLQKFVHGRLPCNYRNNKYYPYKPKYCTKCGEQQDEKQMHFLQCTSCPERVSKRQEFITALRNMLISTGTHETTTRILIHNISSYLNQQPRMSLQEIAPDASEFFKKTVHEQDKIGWDQFLRGRLSINGESYITTI
jgi:hypothetical protein